MSLITEEKEVMSHQDIKGQTTPGTQTAVQSENAYCNPTIYTFNPINTCSSNKLNSKNCTAFYIFLTDRSDTSWPEIF